MTSTPSKSHEWCKSTSTSTTTLSSSQCPTEECNECNELECKCKWYDTDYESTGELLMIRWLVWIIIRNYDYMGMKLDWSLIVKNFDRFLTTKQIAVILNDMFAMGQETAIEIFSSYGYCPSRGYDYDLNPPIFGLLRYNDFQYPKDKYIQIWKAIIRGKELYHTKRLCNLMTGYDQYFYENICEPGYFNMNERSQTLLQRTLETCNEKPSSFLMYLLDNMALSTLKSSYRNWTPLHEAILIGDSFLMAKLLRVGISPLQKGSRVVKKKDSQFLYNKYFKNDLICDKCGLSSEWCANGDLMKTLNIKNLKNDWWKDVNCYELAQLKNDNKKTWSELKDLTSSAFSVKTKNDTVCNFSTCIGNGLKWNNCPKYFCDFAVPRVFDDDDYNAYYYKSFDEDLSEDDIFHNTGNKEEWNRIVQKHIDQDDKKSAAKKNLEEDSDSDESVPDLI